MTLTITLLWWYAPAALAAAGVFFLPAGPGGFVVSCLLWILAIGMVAGHYLQF